MARPAMARGLPRPAGAHGGANPMIAPWRRRRHGWRLAGHVDDGGGADDCECGLQGPSIVRALSFFGARGPNATRRGIWDVRVVCATGVCTRSPSSAVPATAAAPTASSTSSWTARCWGGGENQSSREKKVVLCIIPLIPTERERNKYILNTFISEESSAAAQKAMEATRASGPTSGRSSPKKLDIITCYIAFTTAIQSHTGSCLGPP